MKLYIDNKFVEETEIYPVNKKFTGMIEFTSGTKRWYFGGNLHREAGPASEDSNGDKKWFLFGKECTEQQHKLLVDILKLKKVY